MPKQEYDPVLSAAITGCIQRYIRLFGEQLRQAKATGSPPKITFPPPENDIESEALRLFYEKLAEMFGVRVPDASTDSNGQLHS